MAVRAVLFDLDGTLLASIDGIIASFRHVLGTYLPTKHYTREELVLKIGEPVAVQMLGFADGDAALAAKMVDAYRAHNATILPTLPLYPHVTETLRELTRRGFKTGVVTSKSRGTAMVSLDGHELTPLLDLIMTTDDTPKHKPDPMPLLVAAQRLGLAPAEVAYVGDSVHDIRCALGAGSLAIGALWGPFDPDLLASLRPHYLVDSLPALLELDLLRR